MAVPTELGGLGYNLAEVCKEERRLARRAPATALATNMHVYWTGLAADLWRQGDKSCQWILEEVRRAILNLLAERELPHDPLPIINWFADKTRLISPSPTGKQRSRDPKDDPILGTAFSARPAIIVSLDRDLLVLEKPFGIAVLRPREFLARLQRPI